MSKPIAAAAALLLLLVSCTRTPPENVAAMVNDRAITNEDLERQFKQQYPDSANASDDQLLIAKLETLRSLIDGEIMLQRSEKMGLLATDADVDAKLNELKSPMTTEEFQHSLESRNMTIDELRRQIRRNLSIDKLFNKDITSKITITDDEIRKYYETHRANFAFVEPQLHLAQILVTPRADSELRNLKNDNAETEEEARRKVQMIETRIKAGEDFALLAQSFSEDAATALNGGDLGFIAESALDKVNPDLRKLLLSMPAGSVSPIIGTPEGYRMFKVFSREAAGQRDLSDPRVQQTIRQTLLESKEQLLKSAYYEMARNDSTVRNLFAEKVIAQRRKS